MDHTSHRHADRHRVRLCAALLVVGAGLAAGPAQAAGWERLTRDDGITVYTQAQPGKEVPRFKGVGNVSGNILHILAVLADIDRTCEWQDACHSRRVIKRDGEFEVTFQIRLEAPWPIADRDVVLSTSASVSPDGDVVKADFKRVANSAVRPASGVVRMSELHGRYRLRRIDDDHTRVQYIIDSDPAGSIPSWFVRYATKWVPVSTIQGLRKQVRKTRGHYDKVIAGYRAKHVRPAKHVQPAKHVRPAEHAN